MHPSRNLEIYSVGRENTQIPCDINVPSTEDSVSRPHLEITITEDGSYYVVDVGSSNGTAVFRNGRWCKITQDYVHKDERIRLGNYETTVLALLSRRSRRK